MPNTRHIRFVPGDTYARTLRVRRTVDAEGTQIPYDFTGYDITCDVTHGEEVINDIISVSFLDRDAGEISLGMSADQTAEAAELSGKVTYELIVNLDDDVILTLLRGKLVSDA